MRRGRWVPVLLLAIGAASLWLHIGAGDGAADADPAAALPVLYVEAPRWNLMDAEGRPTRRLRAERLEQWPDEPGARLIEPRLTIGDGDAHRWLVESERGRLSADGQSLLLEREVVLRGQADGARLRLSTERLAIAGNGHLVETDAPVVLESGNWHFNAGGLRADLGRQRIELLDRVEGTHD